MHDDVHLANNPPPCTASVFQIMRVEFAILEILASEEFSPPLKKKHSAHFEYYDYWDISFEIHNMLYLA